jgi:predicted TIM-barrel fold metal-dependent hydrolase
MKLTDYKPQSKLVTRTTTVDRPRFPVIDAHNHTGGEFGGGWCDRDLSEFTAVLDSAGVRYFVDLDGMYGKRVLQHRLDTFKAAIPERYAVFGGVDWSAWADHGDRFGEWAAGRLREQVRWGAQGLKIWKPLGLQVRDHQGCLVPVDDPRLDPIFQTAAELQVPVTVHIADPVAFFDPVDETNERWEELYEYPDWQFTSPPFPPFLTLLEQFASLVRKHPQTMFIGAHVACYAENLAWVSSLLDSCPNVYLDISARIAELGRAPYSARRFFLEHPDRILFGMDLPADLESYRLHYRFLETDDEYFPYHLDEIPPQGRWRIYGLYLPDEVLRRVYHANAARLLGLSIS